MPALVDCFLQYGVLLSSEQFDLVVKLLNSALVDQQSAMTLLPLMTVIYQGEFFYIGYFCSTVNPSFMIFLCFNCSPFFYFQVLDQKMHYGTTVLYCVVYFHLFYPLPTKTK